MKQRLLFGMLILFSISGYSQVQGPPPVGVPIMYSCDDDFDDFSSFDLFEDGQNSSDYLAPQYYTSETDRNIQINPIAYTESYINTMQGEYIFARVNPINSSLNNTIYKDFVLVTTWFQEPIGDILICSESNTYDLVELSNILLCNSSLNDKVDLSFYSSFSDANSKINSIVNALTGKIYVRADSKIITSYRVSFFNLVMSQKPLINEPTSLEVCDDDSDGIEIFDLSSKTNEIIGTLTDVSVSYHESLNDAENRVNFLSNPYTNTSNPQTIYANVQNLSTGCSAITSFDLIVQDCSTLGVIEINTFYDANINNTFENDEINFFKWFIDLRKK